MKHIVVAFITAVLLFSPTTARKSMSGTVGNTNMAVLLVEKGKVTNITKNIKAKTGVSNNFYKQFSDNVKYAHSSIVVLFALMFALPIAIIFIVYYFRYKSRQAKYRLAEQALSSGQSLPDDFFDEKKEPDTTREKGIKNLFAGVGLFVFLWAITGKFGIGCVGLLIMFTGFGQLVIYYTQTPMDREKETPVYKPNKKSFNKETNEPEIPESGFKE